MHRNNRVVFDTNFAQMRQNLSHRAADGVNSGFGAFARGDDGSINFNLIGAAFCSATAGHCDRALRSISGKCLPNCTKRNEDLEHSHSAPSPILSDYCDHIHLL